MDKNLLKNGLSIVIGLIVIVIVWKIFVLSIALLFKLIVPIGIVTAIYFIYKHYTNKR